MAVDERAGFTGQHVGQVAVKLDALMVAVDRPARLVVRYEVRVGAGQEAEELAEAAVERVELLLLAEVPLADQAGGVASRLEPLGERGLTGGQPLTGASLGEQDWVELM